MYNMYAILLFWFGGIIIIKRGRIRLKVKSGFLALARVQICISMLLCAVCMLWTFIGFSRRHDDENATLSNLPHVTTTTCRCPCAPLPFLLIPRTLAVNVSPEYIHPHSHRSVSLWRDETMPQTSRGGRGWGWAIERTTKPTNRVCILMVEAFFTCSALPLLRRTVPGSLSFSSPQRIWIRARRGRQEGRERDEDVLNEWRVFVSKFMLGTL